jgi:methylenetetrahydrofolate/methylenetetrahydromethanopterin dehydrogenase (NADP+)
MTKPRILIQLDTDAQPSVFDSVVAIDAGVEQLFRHSEIAPDNVRDLVYGAIFTRGPDALKNTAIFIGGSNVRAGEALLEQVKRTFFGPMRVSVMMDANGANTTAAAAVLAVLKHLNPSETTAAVLGATGPVGQRVVRLLAREGIAVRVGSRQLEKAKSVCQAVAAAVPGARLSPHVAASPADVALALTSAQVVVAAGAPGACLLPAEVRRACKSLQVAVDLNAVPPPGLDGVDARDKATQRDGQLCYGALGVGGTKMKIHKAAVRRLFEANDQVLDADEILEIGKNFS